MLECFKSSSPGLFSVLYILFYSWFMQSLVHGSVPPQVQAFELPFAELHGIPASPFPHPVEIPLLGNMSLWFYQPHCLVLCSL